jgi:hypothetical protein
VGDTSGDPFGGFCRLCTDDKPTERESSIPGRYTHCNLYPLAMIRCRQSRGLMRQTQFENVLCPVNYSLRIA